MVQPELTKTDNVKGINGQIIQQDRLTCIPSNSPGKKTGLRFPAYPKENMDWLINRDYVSVHFFDKIDLLIFQILQRECLSG